MKDAYRGTGRTTRQMMLAPQGAIFVWCGTDLDYPRRLAVKIGRTDLRIERPSFYETDAWHGLAREVIDDNALYDLNRSDEQWLRRYLCARQYLAVRPAHANQ